MTRIFVVFVLVCLVMVIGAPANNEQLDKANENNPYVNDVIAQNKAKLSEISQRQEVQQQQQPTEPNAEFKPKPTGTGFARLIDDIFQIPIGVLQSVAKLLSNPFKQIHAEQKDHHVALIQ